MTQGRFFGWKVRSTPRVNRYLLGMSFHHTSAPSGVWSQRPILNVLKWLSISAIQSIKLTIGRHHPDLYSALQGKLIMLRIQSHWFMMIRVSQGDDPRHGSGFGRHTPCENPETDGEEGSCYGEAGDFVLRTEQSSRFATFLYDTSIIGTGHNPTEKFCANRDDCQWSLPDRRTIGSVDDGEDRHISPKAMALMRDTIITMGSVTRKRRGRMRVLCMKSLRPGTSSGFWTRRPEVPVSCSTRRTCLFNSWLRRLSRMNSMSEVDKPLTIAAM